MPDATPGITPPVPYADALAGRDPVAAVADTTARILALISSWSPSDFERSYAPGKWTARQIFIHLAQAELAFGTRARMALSTPDYIAQPFDQDAWIARERSLSGPDAARTFVAMARMNAALYRDLSPTDRRAPFSHPEYGALTVDFILQQSAGHQIHHLKQLEQLGQF